MSDNDTKASASAQPMRLLDYKLSLIADLRDLPSNARVHSEAQLKALGDSMAMFSIVSPVIINARNDILAGHGRVEAARRQGP
jgi:ParB-like chromosome segregation protein Spo0J